MTETWLQVSKGGAFVVSSRHSGTCSRHGGVESWL
ncbi:DUF3761 domain-containing protein [Pseudomonas sp. Pdm06]|nr:DUF3761 domain-containing protein [Pseudomonas sp. Pdm06]